MEIIMRKKGTLKYVSFYVFVFWKSRGHDRPKDTAKVEDELVKGMEAKGWVRAGNWLEDEELYKQEKLEQGYVLREEK